VDVAVETGRDAGVESVDGFGRGRYSVMRMRADGGFDIMPLGLVG
jgi:hypothetical protein